MDTINRIDVNKELLKMLTEALSKEDKKAASVITKIMSFIQDLPNTNYSISYRSEPNQGNKINGNDFIYLTTQGPTNCKNKIK